MSYGQPSKINLAELNKVVREMQNASLEQHKAANGFNAQAAAIVQQGADDKMRAKGWPVNPVSNNNLGGKKTVM